MTNIKNTIAIYNKKLDRLDLELIIAHELKKTREFVLAHPEYELPKFEIENLKLKILRHMRNEPLAHILGHKEFYGIDFKINRATLIPRPETELLVELVLSNIQNSKFPPKADQPPADKIQNSIIIDIGTGSGNIIISLAKKLKNKKIEYFGIDISNEALKIAKYNATKNKVNKKIKFLHGNLLNPMLKKDSHKIPDTKYQILIVANLPYLSKKIYTQTLPNVKSYEPKTALYSPQNGLSHYKKLLQQTKKYCSLFAVRCSLFLEFSPEQKKELRILIKKILPSAQVKFKKDLAQKWRVCAIEFPLT